MPVPSISGLAKLAWRHPRYVEHLIGHIEKEDSVLLRLADELLDDAATASLEGGFGRAESEFGVVENEKYEQIASNLEREWAL